MGYKMGFILSLIFVVQLFVMVGDLMSIQFIYTNLDAISVTAGHIISQKGMITDEVIRLCENEGNAQIVQVGENTPMYGSIFEYKIYTSYEPYIIKNEPMEIYVIRSVVIGYYS